MNGMLAIHGNASTGHCKERLTGSCTIVRDIPGYATPLCESSSSPVLCARMFVGVTFAERTKRCDRNCHCCRRDGYERSRFRSAAIGATVVGHCIRTSALSPLGTAGSVTSAAYLQDEDLVRQTLPDQCAHLRATWLDQQWSR